MSGADEADAQQWLDDLVETPETLLWGAPVTSLHALDAWRATSALIAGWADVPRWATRPWLTPPPPRVARTALTAARLVTRAGDIDIAAMNLRRLFDGDDAAITNRIRDRLPVASPLQPVISRWQVTRSRVATRLAHAHQQDALDLIGLRGRGLSTLAPRDVLSDAWRRDGAPDILLRRAAVTLAAARLGGAGTWAEAGDMTGITARYAPRITRYVISRMGDGAPAELTNAATRLAAETRHGHERAAPPIDSFAALRSYAESIND